MKYLVVATCYNEPDNNEPQEEILVRVADIGTGEKEKFREAYKDELSRIYDVNIEVDFLPLYALNENWSNVATFW